MPLSGYDDLDFCWYFIISNYQNVYCEHTKLATPGGSDGKTSACNEGDPGLIPGLGRSPGKGNDNSLQYSCLKNSRDRGAWWAAVHGVANSWTRMSE